MNANELPVYHRSVLGKHFEAIGIMRRKNYSWRKVAEVLASHFNCAGEGGEPLSYGYVYKWFQAEQRRRRKTYIAEIRKEVRPVLSQPKGKFNFEDQPLSFERKRQ